MNWKYAFYLVFLTSFITFRTNAQYKFTIEKKVEATPVKNQQRTGTCWSFSTASFIESELIRLGKGQHDLSEMYVARRIYREKALNYMRRQGKAQFSQGSLAHDLINTIGKYGIVPEQAYSGKVNGETRHDHAELASVLTSIMKTVVKRKRPTQKWLPAFEGVLDAYLGKVPEKFTYQNKEYTPKSFAQWLGVNPADYVELTSYTHQPYYKAFVLEIPDNFSNGAYYNLPIDELEAVAKNAIQSGYSMVWDGDVSEKGFSQKNDVAIVPKKQWTQMASAERKKALKNPVEERKVTQKMRQETFENYSTTDDHLMHLIGTAKDQNSNRYYLIKNSWGVNAGSCGGYVHASQAYFRLKTVSLLVHKDAIPKQIRKKLAL
ncbi:C1 family peptidase [Microscilla marina]|uniref:Aminopeptidase n=1 Tax=Microscilla marina ATCC 23134 TaxID=313606 RepID=A1ZZE0_MICM2|nr:C1 family peptidase [Microscilla marina]EAY24239.1 aminopeptidase C [Microscilla marina ATCC 23134]